MVVCFVPYFELGNKTRLENVHFYDDKMFSDELATIDCILQNTNIHLIVKSLKGTANATLLEHYCEMNNHSFEHSTKSLISELQRSDCAIIDYPSSAIMDVIEVGIPGVVLINDYFKIRNAATQSLPNIDVKIVSDIDQRKREVLKYLMKLKK